LPSFPNENGISVSFSSRPRIGLTTAPAKGASTPILSEGTTVAGTPYTPTPLNSNAYPPADYAKTHNVKDGDNWWSLQKLYGRSNAWDLIVYNFDTNDSNEVNWYLKNKIGCKLVTADGKNYRFSSIAKPGIIYIPPANWAPGKAGSETDSLPPDSTSPLSEDDLGAKMLVLATLMGGDFPNFKFALPGGYEISRVRLRTLIALISSEKIKVRLGGSQNGPAKYFPKENVLNVPYGLTFDAEGKALMIHELVHALLDVDGSRTGNMADKHSEAAAYIAQMAYLIGHKDSVRFRHGFPVRKLTPGEKRSREEFDDNRIFKIAWEVAKELADRVLEKPTHTYLDYQVARVGYWFLTGAIASHTQYKHYANDPTGYDGVK